MEITSVSFLIDQKRAVLEKKLSSSALVDDYDIEDLDKTDSRKDVVVTFKEPVSVRFIQETLKKIVGEIGAKRPIAEEE